MLTERVMLLHAIAVHELDSGFQKLFARHLSPCFMNRHILGKSKISQN